jgi:hypothetical protein
MDFMADEKKPMGTWGTLEKARRQNERAWFAMKYATKRATTTLVIPNSILKDMRRGRRGRRGRIDDDEVTEIEDEEVLDRS